MTQRELGGSTGSISEPREGTPLYVHLPFCATKCHYCDFFSVPGEGQDIDATVQALLAEIDARAPYRPRTVFLGGGTPSLLSCKQLERLLDGIQRRTAFRESAIEVTAECNPESLDLDKARCLLQLGVDRLSIGFQSLHDETLHLLGRVHSAADSFRAYEDARRAGASNVNVDLIYATPGQTLDQWQEDLDVVLALTPDHLSAYNLTFEEGTLFRKWQQQGSLDKLPDDLELAYFECTRSLLHAAGLTAYEISNFCRVERYCHHNINYWMNGEYVGVGPSAVSKIGTRRFGNARSIAEYRRRIAERATTSVWEESLGPWARLGETWWLGLRLAAGVSAAEARSRAGVINLDDGDDPTTAVASRLARAGLLERVGERWSLSADGLPVADAVAREFLQVTSCEARREAAHESRSGLG